MDQPQPQTILTTITYWSINRADISIAVCIFLFTVIICFVVAMYVDKQIIKIQDLKNARMSQLANL